MRLLDKVMRNFIKVGSLTVIDVKGKSYVYGNDSLPKVTIRLRDKKLYHQLFINPELYAGEAFMDNTLLIEDGSLRDFFRIVMTNRQHLMNHPAQKLVDRFFDLFKFSQQWNPISKAQKNVAHHYNLSNDFYQMFLDKGLNYSCAYYNGEHESLEVAQQNKLTHIAAKLDLLPGQHVLDIGSGWGSLAFYLASVSDVQVLGLTLSNEQYQFAVEKAKRLGIEDRVRFELKDYRQIDQQFDRIVSVGMFEHVGAQHFPEFFDQFCKLLKDDGVALLHSIGQPDKPGTTQPWLRKYIFPGGYAPSLSEVFKAIEPTGMWVSDVEILRNHYAYTLRDWEKRFQENRAAITELFDERFCRMWEFYLLSCEAAFLYGNHMVFQMQIIKNQHSLPVLRDYMRNNELDLLEKAHN